MIFIIITIGLFILELCIKNHIVKTKPLNEEVPIIKDKLAIQYTQNKGAFYSTFEDKSKVICGLSSGFLAVLCIIKERSLLKINIKLKEENNEQKKIHFSIARCCDGIYISSS